VFDFLTMRVTPTQAVAPRAVPPGAEASRPARPRADKYRPLNSSEEARGRIPE